MNVGAFRHPIAIQEYRECGKDSAGNIVCEWTDIHNAFASVKDVSGADYFKAASYNQHDRANL